MYRDGRYVAKSQGWRCDDARDGRTDILLLQYLHFRHPWRSYSARSQDGGATMPAIGRRIYLLFFIWLAAANQPAWAETACPGTRYDEKTSIKYIHDGDTLHLKDGRKVRLIGINTPEVAHGDKAAEPYSAEAKNALKALFSGSKTVSLIYGKEKQDRYQRLLAHAFTENGDNIQAVLLEQGLAHAVAFPPNTQFSACYKQQQRKARCAGTGLWQKTKPLAAKSLGDTDIGFQLVKGKLKDININTKGIWLNMDDQLTVGIRPDQQQLFDINAIYKLLEENIVVHGWLNKSKKALPYYMRIRHPSSLQSAAAFSCD